MFSVDSRQEKTVLYDVLNVYIPILHAYPI